MKTQRRLRQAFNPYLENRIEHVLRASLPSDGTLRRRFGVSWRRKGFTSELVSSKTFKPDVFLWLVGIVGAVANLVGDAPTATELHRPRPNEIHLRLRDAAVRTFDQRAGNSTPRKIACKGKSDRASADD